MLAFVLSWGGTYLYILNSRNTGKIYKYLNVCDKRPEHLRVPRKAPARYRYTGDGINFGVSGQGFKSLPAVS